MVELRHSAARPQPPLRPSNLSAAHLAPVTRHHVQPAPGQPPVSDAAGGGAVSMQFDGLPALWVAVGLTGAWWAVRWLADRRRQRQRAASMLGHAFAPAPTPGTLPNSSPTWFTRCATGSCARPQHRATNSGCAMPDTHPPWPASHRPVATTPPLELQTTPGYMGWC